MSFTEDKNDGAVYAGQPKNKLDEIMEQIRGIDTFEKLAEFAGVDITTGVDDYQWISFEGIYFYKNGIAETLYFDTTSWIKHGLTYPQMAIIIAGLRGL